MELDSRARVHLEWMFEKPARTGTGVVQEREARVTLRGEATAGTQPSGEAEGRAGLGRGRGVSGVSGGDLGTERRPGDVGQRTGTLVPGGAGEGLEEARTEAGSPGSVKRVGEQTTPKKVKPFHFRAIGRERNRPYITSEPQP
jgi:hypothetical protein